jgi:predicted DNA-binding transcriptional regulator AlpA
MTTSPKLVPIGTKRDQGVCAALGGITPPTVYSLINRGELTRVHIGRRSFVTAESIDAYVERITAAACA